MAQVYGSATKAVGGGAKGLAKVGQGFKEFISRGSVVDLAVGVVIGAAFANVINAFVEAILNPLIGWIFGQPNLDKIWTIKPWDDKEAMLPGVFLTQLITFLLTALAIYLCVILPMNALAARRKRGEEPEPAAPAEDILLLQEIRDLLATQNAAHGPAQATDLGSTPPPPPGAPPAPPSFPPTA